MFLIQDGIYSMIQSSRKVSYPFEKALHTSYYFKCNEIRAIYKSVIEFY